MADITFIQRNAQTFVEFRGSNPVELVSYNKNGEEKRFLRHNGTPVYATKETIDYMFSGSADVSKLRYAEIKDSSLPDKKDATKPENEMVELNGRRVNNSNWVPCIMKDNTKVIASL